MTNHARSLLQNKRCRFRAGYAPKNVNSIKFEMSDWRPLSTSIYVRKTVTITGNNMRFQVGKCPEQFQLDEIKNSSLAAIIDFNMSDTWKNPVR